MGYYKQLHIDCSDDGCIVGQPDSCYMSNTDLMNDLNSGSITEKPIKKQVSKEDK